jgi:hypothetical protein
MPLNDKKIISIILEECGEMEERCEGYREEMIEVITEVISYERSHRVEATNIQKKINDKCDAVARFLTDKRGGDVSAESGS